MKPIHLLIAAVTYCCILTFPVHLLQPGYAQSPPVKAFTVQTEAEIQAPIHNAILDELMEYNKSQVGAYERKPFSIYIKDTYGKVIAGLTGVALVNYDCLVNIVAVDPAHRRQGYGRQIFSALDTFATEQKCTNIRLETADFQARGFYEKMGYQMVAEIPRSFLGHTSFVMQKKLE